MAPCGPIGSPVGPFFVRMRLNLPNVIVTPHAGSATYEANYRMGMAVADNVIAFMDGCVPPNVVTSLGQFYSR